MRMLESIEIGVARPEEWPAAFELALQHVSKVDRPMRVSNASMLLDAGELDPAGIFVARAPDRLAGVQVCVPLRGSSGIFWLPQVAAAWRRTNLAERLVQAAANWLRGRGAKLAQALVQAADLPQAAPLKCCGFRHVTGLQYLRHDLSDLPAVPGPPELHYRPYAPDIEQTFQQTMLRTYEQTLDCPELNGIRTIEEIMDGHRAQGIWRPENWWLASLAGAPAGIVLLTQLGDVDGYDLSYVGVVPEYRRRGLGSAMALRAMQVAKDHDSLQLLLAVDQRNRPARRLYQALGFDPTESREVLLLIY